MQLLGARGGSAGEAVFRAMLAVPGLYDAFHFAALRTGAWLALLADEAARRQVVPRLRAYLDASPADLVISVFATGAAAASARPRYPAMTHMVFCTDVTPHRLWVHPNVDVYLVTVGGGRGGRAAVPAQARVAGGADAGPARLLHGAQPGRQARARLGVPAAARCVLLMSGAWGLGPVAKAAEALAAAGRRRAGRGRAERSGWRVGCGRPPRQPRVRAFGFTDRIPELMAAADLVITSSGDTCSEARLVGRPLLLLDRGARPRPGQPAARAGARRRG